MFIILTPGAGSVAHPVLSVICTCSAGYECEQRLVPESNYLDYSQPSDEHVTPQMRMIVCSWLSEVATEFNMQQETLFLAVALLDRFMSDSNVSISSAAARYRLPLDSAVVPHASSCVLPHLPALGILPDTPCSVFAGCTKECTAACSSSMHVGGCQA